MKHLRMARSRTVAASAGLLTGLVVTASLAGVASATTEPPTTEAATTAAPTTEAAPEPSAAPAPAGPVVVAETTYSFAEGDYHWSTSHGTVPRLGGDVELAASGATFVFAKSGAVAVSGDDGAAADVAEGTAVARPEGATTVIGAVDEGFGSYLTIDLEAGAPADSTGTPFAPGAGDRTVTLTHLVIEPGAPFDLASVAGDSAYVVVVKGIVDGSDGTALLPNGAASWTAETAAGVTLAPRSQYVAAELLVASVAPAGSATTTVETTTA